MEREDRLKGKTLYVGFDDSNHAGKREGYVIAATFSFNQEDSIVKKFPKRKDSFALRGWLGDPIETRDFRFCILDNDILRFLHQVIPLTIPSLIGAYRDSFSLDDVDKIKIGIDGTLTGRQKKYIQSQLYQLAVSDVVVENFVKTRGVPRCSRLVYMADTLSTELYHDLCDLPDKITTHQKRVAVDEPELLRTLEELKSQGVY